MHLHIYICEYMRILHLRMRCARFSSDLCDSSEGDRAITLPAKHEVGVNLVDRLYYSKLYYLSTECYKFSTELNLVHRENKSKAGTQL